MGFDEDGNVYVDITVTNIRNHVYKGKNYGKEIMFKCNICGFDCLNCYIRGEFRKEYWTGLSHFQKGRGCGCCNNSVIKKEINSVYATHPDLVYLFKDIEDTYKYCAKSHQRVKFICPNCYEIKENMIYLVIETGYISCNKCGNGFSYANKFIYNMLTQLNIHFKSEMVFDWSRNILYKDKICLKKYDFYLPDFNTIIEAHGLQHYRRVGYFHSTDEVRENDSFKEKLALQNDIDNYIILDCQKSNIIYIKNSIINSMLPNMLSFNENDVEWDKCAYYGVGSGVFQVAEIYNSGIHGRNKIAEILGIKTRLVKKYIRQAYEGEMLENYDPQKETERTRFKGKTVIIRKDNIIQYIGKISDLLKLCTLFLSKSRSRSSLETYAKNNKIVEGYQFSYLKNEVI